MKKYLFILIIAGMSVLFYSNLFAQDDNYGLPAGSYEGIFEFKYNKFSKFVPALIYNDSTYIPFIQVVSLLKIYNQYDYKNKIIKGFYLSPDTTFSINLLDSTATVGSRTIKFDPGEFVTTDLEIYVLPSFFKKLFKLDFEVIFSLLTIRLNSMQDMPVLLEEKRKEDYATLGQLEKAYPLLFDRKWSFLNGGLLYYNLNASFDQSLTSAFSGFLSGGIEILGGSLKSDFTSTYNTLSKTFLYDYNYQWRYYFGENPYLTNLTIGEVVGRSYQSSNIPATSLRGVSISNETARDKPDFTKFTIEDKTNPDWQVELWVNGFLADYQIADPLGNYSFNVPISYGYNDIELKFYGTKGEYNVESYRYDVEQMFLKPGEIKYALTGGIMPYYRDLYGNQIYEYVLDGRAAVGIFSWLTNDFSVDKYRIKATGKDEYVFYNRTSFNMFGGKLVPSVDYSPNRALTVNLTSNLREWGYYNAYYSKFPGMSEINTLGSNYTIGFSGGLPTALEWPFTMTVRGTRSKFANYVINDLDLRTGFIINPLMVDLMYKANYVEALNGNVLSHAITPVLKYRWEGAKDVWSKLTTSLFIASAGYDLTNNRLSNVFASLIQPIKNFGTFNIRFRKLFSGTADWQAEVMLRINTNIFDSRSGVNLNSAAATFQQTFTGTLGFDSFSNDFLFQNPGVGTRIGYGAASFRYFLDDNENGELDDGEILVPGVNTEFVEGSISPDRNKDADVRRAYNLYPYSRYKLKVDKKSIKNPLWVPTLDRFSIVADPNSYKPVNVPCYSSAVIEGKITLNNGRYIADQPRVSVHVTAADSTIYSYDETIPVFSDGSFYLMGVPPGDYHLYVDSLQKEILGVVQTKPYIDFTVKKSTEGEYIDGLNVELVPKNLSKYIVDGELKVPKEIAEHPDLASKPGNNGSAGETSVGTNTGNESSLEMGTPKQINKVVPNEVVTLFFPDPDSKELNDMMKNYLEKLVEYMKENPRTIVEIVGHSDEFEDVDKAYNLSLERADEAVKYLTDRGIDSDRIFPIGKGSLENIPATDSKYGLNDNRNRRLEVKVIE